MGVNPKGPQGGDKEVFISLPPKPPPSKAEIRISLPKPTVALGFVIKLPPPEGSDKPIMVGPGLLPLAQDKPYLISRRNWLVAAAAAAAALSGGYVFRREIGEFLGLSSGGLRAYLKPKSTKDIIIGAHKRYPYAESSLLLYAREEQRLLGARKLADKFIILADNIANRAAERVYAE
jgi:hypothetical protein